MTEKHAESSQFGYQKVNPNEKTSMVGQVFDSVADKYDLMNDLMSFGIHRFWKQFALSKANIRPQQKILDLASGTGDIALGMAKLVGAKGTVLMTDINPNMLTKARDRLINQGIINNVHAAQVNAEVLPFPNNYFDRTSIAFGLRNVTHIDKALTEMYRVLIPGGIAIILEFSKPYLPIFSKIYDCYSFSVLPKLGELIANDAESYRYLAESIRMHPNQEELTARIITAGFDECQYYNLTFGVVALHLCYKY